MKKVGIIEGIGTAYPLHPLILRGVGGGFNTPNHLVYGPMES